MQDVAVTFLTDDDTVETYFGCIIDVQPVAELAADIVDGSLPRSFRGTQR